MKKSIFKTYRSGYVYTPVSIEHWKLSLSEAQDPNYPSRKSLIRLYETSMMDGHLKSLVRLVRASVFAMPYHFLDVDGQSHSFDWMDAMWFRNLLKGAFESIYYGYSVFEVTTYKRGEIIDLKAVPRQHIEPSRGYFYPSLWEDKNPIAYRETEAYRKYFFESYDEEGLGELLEAVPLVALKRMYQNDMSLYSELFGMPHMTALVENISDEKAVSTALKYLNSLQTGRYGVFGKGTEIQIHEQQKGGAGIYIDGTKSAEAELSKLIIGGDSSMEAKAFVGSTQVQEDYLSKIVDERRGYISRWVNHHVCPRLIDWGYPLSNLRFAFSQAKNIDVIFKRAMEMHRSGIDIDLLWLSQTTGIPLMKAKKESQSEEKNKGIVPHNTPKSEDVQMMVSEEDLDALYPKHISKVGWFLLPKFLQKSAIKISQLLNAIHDGDAGALEIARSLTMRNIPLSSGDKLIKSALDYDWQRFTSAKAAKVILVLQEMKKSSRDKKEFMSKARGKAQQYFYQWQTTESNTARAAAAMAQRFRRFEQEVDQYPNLRFTFSISANRRDTHEKLVGTIKPVHDPFWKTHLPPIDLECKCSVIQTDEPPTLSSGGITLKSSILSGNPALSLRLFADTHPYYKVSDSIINKGLQAAGYGLANQVQGRFKEARELQKNDYTPDQVWERSGAAVMVKGNYPKKVRPVLRRIANLEEGVVSLDKEGVRIGKQEIGLVFNQVSDMEGKISEMYSSGIRIIALVGVPKKKAKNLKIQFPHIKFYG